MKILARRDNLRLTVLPGDTFVLRHNETTVLRHEVTATQIIDTALVVEAEPGELGLEYGIGGVFGRKEAS